MVGCLLNLRKAALRRRIAFLQSLLNQGVSCLFKVEIFVIDSFAIDINVSVQKFCLVCGVRVLEDFLFAKGFKDFSVCLV